MCGIAGLFTGSDPDGLTRVEAMLQALAHRGPDDSGLFATRDSQFVLGHRRLAIVDLSPAGHQPMVSRSGRYTLVYNGEIYNFLAMRDQLDAGDGVRAAWRGHSDTEVLLAGFDAWGIDATIARANGMFAFAVWDAQSEQLTLGRDRLGEKPLYFGWIANKLAFASELKAFHSLPGWDPRMHAGQVSRFLLSGYVHGAESAIRGVFRLPAASLLSFGPDDFAQARPWHEIAPRLRTYWSLADAAARGGDAPLGDEPGAAASQLLDLLDASVRSRLIADVPLGAFLSGGVDSSLLVALMQRASAQPVRTFTMGFEQAAFDEAPRARAIARHLGTDHVETYVTEADALATVPGLAALYDEPFSDTSQIPTLLVSTLARKQVTVAISGDGGDELFGGYTRYRDITRLWRLIGPLPPSMRRGLSVVVRNASTGFRARRFSERLAAASDLDSLRLAYIGGGGVDALRAEPRAGRQSPDMPAAITDTLRRLMYADQADYLPDDILFKVDRASMSAGLETRAPFLDPQVVEWSWRLRSAQLRHRGSGKVVLREALHRLLPAALVGPGKRGFSPPIDAWLRGPLKAWVSDLLSRDGLRELPMVDSTAVAALWQSHLAHRVDAGQAIWNVTMLSAWRRSVGAGN